MAIAITKELAKPELIEFLDSVGVDTDTENMIQDDRDDFNALLNTILKPMLQGRAAIDSDAYVLTLHKPAGDLKEIRIEEPTGLAWELMDRAKKGEDMKRVMRFVEGFTGVPYAQLCKLNNRDIKVLTKFAQLFMG